MEGDVEGLEDLKFQGLYLIQKSILTRGFKKYHSF